MQPERFATGCLPPCVRLQLRCIGIVRRLGRAQRGSSFVGRRFARRYLRFAGARPLSGDKIFVALFDKAIRARGAAYLLKFALRDGGKPIVNGTYVPSKPRQLFCIIRCRPPNRQHAAEFAAQPLQFSALVCFCPPMGWKLQERSRWLAQNVLPHEGLLRSQLRNVHIYNLDIEDVIQETYTRMLSVEALETIRYPKQYALQTARAIIVDHVRHSRVVSIIAGGSLEALDIPEPAAGAEQRMEFQQEVVAVNRALSRLPRLWREVLILRRIDGLSQKEVAGRLGISERTVEKYLGNGARLLARVFSHGGKWRARTSNTEEEVDIRNVDQPGH